MTNRENYAYWQHEGGGWEQVYADRMRDRVYYHLQELTIVEYMTANQPSSVLEVGMGVGRHVKNLRQAFDTYGFDQSETMFEVVRRTSDAAWFDTHCRLGSPTGPLPYEDHSIDIVFTSEVLVHVHPDDLEELLRELMRVARWQVFHVEPARPDLIVAGDHGGCWYHDLPALYAGLGVECETLPAPYSAQQPMRVLLDRERPAHDLSPAFLQVARAMETQLQPTLDRAVLDAHEAAQLPVLREDRDRLWSEVQSWSSWAKQLEGESAALVTRASALEATVRAMSDLNELVTAQMAQQGRLLSLSEERVAGLESQLAHVREELDRCLDDLEAMSSQSRAWRAVASARSQRRSLDRELSKAGIESVEPFERSLTSLARGQLALAPTSHGEVWVLDVADVKGLRDLSSVQLPAGWQRTESAHSMNGTALVGERRAGELTLEGVDSHTTLRFLRHPWSGSVALRAVNSSAQVDLTYQGTTVVEVRPTGERVLPGIDSLVGVITDPVGRGTELAAEDFWHEVQRCSPAALSVCHPEWRGIRTSMQNLFSFSLLVEDAVTESDARLIAGRIADAGVPAVVTGGFPRTYVHLLEALKERGVRCFVTWHGSFMQLGEPYNRASMNEVLGLATSGAIDGIGFVKSGMAEIYRKRGVRATTLLNYVRALPAPPSLGSGGDRPSLGVWSLAPVWRKLPYAMVAACAEITPSPRVFASGHDQAAMELAESLGVDLHLLGGAVPHEEMSRWLASMDLNLYVTLSECAPMLPLESLAVGVPCLLGPNAHYFDDDPFLRSRLVVDEPDRHERIAASIRRAIDQRDEIVEHYRSMFYATHAAAARARVLEFVGAELDAVI